MDHPLRRASRSNHFLSVCPLFAVRDADGTKVCATNCPGANASAAGMNLDGLSMYVSTTAACGQVGTDTQLHLAQWGSRVFGRYAGGAIKRGFLVGRLAGAQLAFRYTQLEASGEIHGGCSRGEVQRRSDGRIRIVEHFVWRTRAGSGVNVFDEIGVRASARDSTDAAPSG